MSTKRTQRMFIVIDVEHPYDERYWKEGMPDFLHIALSDTSEGRIKAKDLTVYKTLPDMLADVEESKDMFKV